MLIEQMNTWPNELIRQRFRAGHTPTSFIEEEYPEGFKGVALAGGELNRVLAAAVLVHSTRQTRFASSSSPSGAASNPNALSAASSLASAAASLSPYGNGGGGVAFG